MLRTRYHGCADVDGEARECVYGGRGDDTSRGEGAGDGDRDHTTDGVLDGAAEERTGEGERVSAGDGDREANADADADAGTDADADADADVPGVHARATKMGSRGRPVWGLAGTRAAASVAAPTAAAAAQSPLVCPSFSARSAWKAQGKGKGKGTGSGTGPLTEAKKTSRLTSPWDKRLQRQHQRPKTKNQRPTRRTSTTPTNVFHSEYVATALRRSRTLLLAAVLG